MTETTTIAAESGHWYRRDGSPCYELPNASKPGQMRATTIKDARKLDLVPSVTTITKIMAAPGLENWKTEQVLISAYTMPQEVGEMYDVWGKRVRAEAKLKAAAAAERGTALHGAIEQSLRGHSCEFVDHVEAVGAGLRERDIDLSCGKPEHSFAHPLGYGGKVDWHNDSTVVDFKTKDKIEGDKNLVWDEHHCQLAAYAHGLPIPDARCLNVFIGVTDCKVVVVEHTPEEIERGWQMFQACLRLWQIKNAMVPA